MEKERIELAAIVNHYFSKYPPILSVSQVAEILKINEPALRAQISRKAFPVRVRKVPGLGIHILLLDLITYITTGNRQVPIPDEYRHKIPGKKRGRPTKREEIEKRKRLSGLAD